MMSAPATNHAFSADCSSEHWRAASRNPSATISASHDQTQSLENGSVAVSLARQLMEEIAAKPLVASDATPGWAGGVNDRNLYDTVNDYAGYVDSTPVATREGPKMSIGSQPYTRKVKITYPTDLFGTTSAAGEFAVVEVSVQSPSGQRCILSRIDVNRKALQAALADNTHPSTIDIARQLGVQLQNLIKWLPDLCKQVSRQHIEGRNNRWFKIDSELNAMLGEWPPPSMGEICKRIGYCRTSLNRHHSRVCYRLAARHVKFRNNKLRCPTPSV